MAVDKFWIDEASEIDHKDKDYSILKISEAVEWKDPYDQVREYIKEFYSVEWNEIISVIKDNDSEPYKIKAAINWFIKKTKKESLPNIAKLLWVEEEYVKNEIKTIILWDEELHDALNNYMKNPVVIYLDEFESTRLLFESWELIAEKATPAQLALIDEMWYARWLQNFLERYNMLNSLYWFSLLENKTFNENFYSSVDIFLTDSFVFLWDYFYERNINILSNAWFDASYFKSPPTSEFHAKREWFVRKFYGVTSMEFISSDWWVENVYLSKEWNPLTDTQITNLMIKYYNEEHIVSSLNNNLRKKQLKIQDKNQSKLKKIVAEKEKARNELKSQVERQKTKIEELRRKLEEANKKEESVEVIKWENFWVIEYNENSPYIKETSKNLKNLENICSSISEYLSNNPNNKIRVEWHTSRSWENLSKLSLQRALTFKNYLIVNFNVDADRIETVWKWWEEPLFWKVITDMKIPPNPANQRIEVYWIDDEGTTENLLRKETDEIDLSKKIEVNEVLKLKNITYTYIFIKEERQLAYLLPSWKVYRWEPVVSWSLIKKYKTQEWVPLEEKIIGIYSSDRSDFKLKEWSQESINVLTNYMLKFPSATIRIDAHTSYWGGPTSKINKLLENHVIEKTKKQWNLLKIELLRAWIDSERITVVWHWDKEWYTKDWTKKWVRNEITITWYDYKK